MSTFLLTSFGLYSGAALCSAVVARGAWSLWKGWLHRQQQQKKTVAETAGFLKQVRAVRLRNRAANPLRAAWKGTRSLRVIAVADEAEDCRSIYLADPTGSPLPAFQSGQYLTFELAQSNSDRPLVRCYSLSDRPRSDYYRVTIKRALPPAQLSSIPPGLGSSYFFNHVRPGTMLDVKAPAGNFFLDPSHRDPVVLIGGGIGITPVLAMLNTIVHEQPGRRVFFFSGMRSCREHPFQHHLRAIAAEHPQVTLHISHSSPGPGEVPFRDFDYEGRITIEVLRKVLPSNNFRFYVCGSGAMMADLIPALEAWGVPERDIHYESFGPSTTRKLKQLVMSLDEAPANAPRVRFERSGCEVEWKDSADSLLALAEQQNLPLDAGCRTGNCGTCVIKLLQGKVTYARPPGVPLQPGECLPCVAIPTGDVILDA